MITPSVINSVGSSVVWEMTVTNGPTPNTAVTVNLTIPADFTVTNSYYDKGTLAGSTWTIGNMVAGEIRKLTLIIQLTETPENFVEEYEFDATVSSGVDTIITNNLLTDAVTYNFVSADPMAGGVADDTSCLCVDVSTNDTPCSAGTTEWRLDEDSIVNGELVSWDEETGKGNFTAIDPTLEITFTYDLFCVSGEDEYEISPNVPVTIHPQLVDKDIFDHTIIQVLGGDLTAPQIAVLEAQYPDIDVELFDWNILVNGDGDPTSGVQLPVTKQLAGFLCDGDGNTVFVFNTNGEVEFELADGTEYLGAPLDLTTCCNCAEEIVE